MSSNETPLLKGVDYDRQVKHLVNLLYRKKIFPFYSTIINKYSFERSRRSNKNERSLNTFLKSSNVEF